MVSLAHQRGVGDASFGVVRASCQSRRRRRPGVARGAFLRVLSCAIVGVACSVSSASAPTLLPELAGSVQGLPAASDVLAAMRLVNAHFAARWPDPTIDIVTDRARPSNLWTRAVYFEGLMALYAVESDAALKANYYEYAVRWGESPSHPWQVAYGVVTTLDADHHACGQTYLDLYAIEPEPVRIAHVEASIRHLIASGNTRAWWWIDALQMAMPVLARLGVLRNDASYLEAMWALYSHTRDAEGGGLFDEGRGLWWRDANYSPGDVHILSPNGRAIYWSRGNGWVLAALARVLEVLPANDPHRGTYEADFLALAAAIIALQRADGFWNASLADPTHCAAAGERGEDGPETSGTALFTYGLAWGIRHGLLDAAKYGPPLLAAWNGMMRTAVRPDGFLGRVQPTGAAPCSGPGPLGSDIAPDFEDFGVGCFLLAGSEVLRLGRHTSLADSPNGR
jgi:unsaturated rhamnogalacturonyl hydrolase